MVGGDIDKNAISEAFSKIKEDMLKLNQELYQMKSEQKKLIEENINLRHQQSIQTEQLTNQNSSSNQIDPILLSQIVKETLKHAPKKDMLVKRLNKKRKGMIRARISSLASQKNLGISEIKDIVVDNEGLCSKATFYRYITKLKSQGILSEMKINDVEVLVNI